MGSVRCVRFGQWQRFASAPTVNAGRYFGAGATCGTEHGSSGASYPLRGVMVWDVDRQTIIMVNGNDG